MWYNLGKKKNKYFFINMRCVVCLKKIEFKYKSKNYIFYTLHFKVSSTTDEILLKASLTGV